MNIDIFSGDAFSLTSLTDAINQMPLPPTRVGELGLFQPAGIFTTSIEVEFKAGVLTLVPAKDRNAAPTPKTVGRRTLRQFKSIHLPQEVVVMADEVQNLRAFGSETETQVAQSLLNEKNEVALQDLSVTLEWQRLGAIKGQVLDADGTTVLTDLFAEFGVSQNVHAMDLDVGTTNIATKCREVKRKIEAELGGLSYRSIRVLCGYEFFDAFVSHDDVKESYRLWQNSAALRADNRTGFAYSDNMVFEEYLGVVGGVAFIAPDEAYAIPMGVPNLFIAKYAPANYMETVNTRGLPVYQKLEPLPMNKGVKGEVQSNPLNICTRPRAIVKLTKT